MSNRGEYAGGSPPCTTIDPSNGHRLLSSRKTLNAVYGRLAALHAVFAHRKTICCDFVIQFSASASIIAFPEPSRRTHWHGSAKEFDSSWPTRLRAVFLFDASLIHSQNSSCSVQDVTFPSQCTRHHRCYRIFRRSSPGTFLLRLRRERPPRPSFASSKDLNLTVTQVSTAPMAPQSTARPLLAGSISVATSSKPPTFSIEPPPVASLRSRLSSALRRRDADAHCTQAP
ncbi:hypothetical protein D9611_010925 [Ephemerocybe angulata]|uniref:Uncharacterized protein n=1 Tax=Ephemerocybe angulata TaxID=980116 RepID=A0A8H5C4R0_9AGAR|nr:hypothetical protein D9611_010925 [Tulosesus angulatus]